MVQSSWGKNKNKKFIWKIDRANPKVALPINYDCEVTFEDQKNLNLKVTNGSEIFYDINLKHMAVY